LANYKLHRWNGLLLFNLKYWFLHQTSVVLENFLACEILIDHNAFFVAFNCALNSCELRKHIHWRLDRREDSLSSLATIMGSELIILAVGIAKEMRLAFSEELAFGFLPTAQGVKRQIVNLRFLEVLV
jgi:hypothetical protein